MPVERNKLGFWCVGIQNCGRQFFWCDKMLPISHKTSFLFGLLWILSWSAIIKPFKVNGVPPNIIIVLTDDQDVVLNGMVRIGPRKISNQRFSLDFDCVFVRLNSHRHPCNEHKNCWRAEGRHSLMRFVYTVNQNCNFFLSLFLCAQYSRLAVNQHFYCCCAIITF